MSEAETADREGNRTGEEDGNRLPKTLAKKDERKSRIRKCLADLEAKAERLEREKEEKAEKRSEREKTSGPLRGRKSKAAPVDSEALKANTTDPESRIMKSRKEGYVQAYNARIVVTEDQIIVGAEITQEANDQHQLLPMLEATRHTLKTAGIDETPQEVVADTGYWNEEEIEKEKMEMTEFFLNPFRKARGRKGKDGGEPVKKPPTPFEEKMHSDRAREDPETARRHGGGSLRPDQDRPGREPVHAAGIFGVCVGMEAHLRRAQLVEALESPE